MPTVTVTNRTAVKLPVNSFVGTLNPNEVRQLDLTSNEMELSRSVLVALASASQISWVVNPSSSNADNQGEVVTGGAKVLAGTGDPNNSVTGSRGDLYVRKDGGANSTLYVKETGDNTKTGWTAK